MKFFEKFRDKKDGVIRFYDLNSKKVKLISVLIFLMVVISIFPAI